MTAEGALAILRATERVCSARASAGTTSLTSPQRTPCSAVMMSPVRSMCMAALYPTARPRATPGVWQKSPMLTPGVEKVAPSPAMHMSAVAASWHPAAVANPEMLAITGSREERTLSMSLLHVSKMALVSPVVSWASCSSLRLCPLLNTFPVCASTTTLTWGSASSFTSASWRSVIIVVDRQFRVFWSWRVTVATWSDTSTPTRSVEMPALPLSDLGQHPVATSGSTGRRMGRARGATAARVGARLRAAPAGLARGSAARRGLEASATLPAAR
mmetsp:Transcript_13601/g.34832  ORF Transcript_13601/g.34832 Transcript_13601/m.34832 type:complete len:273 (-) Transcript_13601:85-903(-)